MLQTVDDSSLSPTRDHGAIDVHGNARRAAEAEYRTQRQQIAKLQRQIVAHDEHLDRLAGAVAVQGEEQRALVEDRVAAYNADPRSIAPEDALDTIVRLENHLKLQKRRNLLHNKELDKDRRNVKERRKVLEQIAIERDNALSVTGWDKRSVRSEEEQEEMKGRISEMAELAKRLREEHRAAYLIIHKKEHIVQFLHVELDKRNEQLEQLDMKHNTIRCLDRDIRELQTQLEKLGNQSHETDNQVTVAHENQDTVAVKLLGEDNAYLSEEVRRKKEKRTQQTEVTRAQEKRIKDLTTRFEVLGGALRDLGLDRRVQRTLTAGPPAIDATTEPSDMSRIKPPQEQVPTSMYELLVRDMANIRSAVARKDVMVLEKQCVVRALQEKFEEYSEELRYAREQEAYTKDDKYIEMLQLRDEFGDKRDAYRREIDELQQRNLKLKKKVVKSAAV